MNKPENPYQSPEAATGIDDEQRTHQLWEATYQDLALRFLFFANGALKIYVNDQLSYDACKWYAVTEIATFTYKQHDIHAVVKSNLIRVRLELTINGDAVPVIMTQALNKRSNSKSILDRLRRGLHMVSFGATLFIAYILIRKLFL